MQIAKNTVATINYTLTDPQGQVIEEGTPRDLGQRDDLLAVPFAS